MLKLMQYEFRKTLAAKLILLGITALAEIVYLIALYTDAKDTMYGSVIALVLLAEGGLLVMGLQSVLTLHRDMNTRQGYMLFMTPNSCHAILGAKVLECALSILIAGAFYFALGALDISLLFVKSATLNELWELVQEFLKRVNQTVQPNKEYFASLLFYTLTAWINTILIAYLADVVSAALLNGKKHNGLLSFALFLALAWAAGRISGMAGHCMADFNLSMVVQGGVHLVLAGIMYVITAQIMERKLSV